MDREIEVGVCEGVDDVGTPSLRPVMCSLRVAGRTMGVEVSHEDVVTTGVGDKVTRGREIGWTGGVRGM